MSGLPTGDQIIATALACLDQATLARLETAVRGAKPGRRAPSLPEGSSHMGAPDHPDTTHAMQPTTDAAAAAGRMSDPNPAAKTLMAVSSQLDDLHRQTLAVADDWHDSVPGHHYHTLLEAGHAIAIAAADLRLLANTDVSSAAARLERHHAEHDGHGDDRCDGM